ncbi:MAG: oligosaccharide flippase family protein [Nannocystis sp.]|uniref:oligosaccharide flippase family protein n=1 Tax=Nannocystis sp. TaxID=1962667 RepID=UPI0024210028|nr:oligosaccharide flippase family protein [Nannocystis sp.]MBK9757256.1 oligosaccharide flippase family protein [Nannocystis sp.]
MSQSLAWVGGVSVVLGVANVASMGVILALWISPEEYGVAALALAAFPILELATEMGLVSAIIQQGDHDQARLSTIFWLNMGATIIIVLVLTLVVAPLLAELYEAPIVGAMLQVYGIKLLLQNVLAVPYGLMARDLRFKEISLVRMFANFGEIVVRILVAASILGIWCFVLAAIVRTIIWAIRIRRCNAGCRG